jgi:hypothetical protein
MQSHSHFCKYEAKQDPDSITILSNHLCRSKPITALVSAHWSITVDLSVGVSRSAVARKYPFCTPFKNAIPYADIHSIHSSK